ncbi:uncharacterized protein N7500_001594 [Penicillium coprophilum]|uniref:uncharacterized protein n=1 Tax=Penicillium coprophilum TaxID=36646 RepID=UPI0023A17D96|nr:uncharacterized protein N7500_001594 [Penicillium coprophilum]KAJ5173663.1 hypothetical protein N7500_001594 [Penicillium coprophilum]
MQTRAQGGEENAKQKRQKARERNKKKVKCETEQNKNAQLGAWRSPRTLSVISPEPRCAPCGTPFPSELFQIWDSTLEGAYILSQDVTNDQ